VNYITAENLSKAFTEVPLFSGISISLQKNQKLALIGANGSGKSTLLKMLAGKEQPDSGTINIRNGVSVGYLEQDPYLNPSSRVIDTLFDMSDPVMKLLGEYEALVDLGERADPDKLHRLIDAIDAAGAWDFESRAREVLSKLGIHDMEQPASQLSGGQKKRVALARLLITAPDLLLLDEPTNHLDLDMIEWLENYLSGLSKTILMISHDRYFIERVCDTIAEMQPDRIWLYKGNYAYYLEKKGEREFREAREIDKAENLLRTELDWMRRQPKARGTKQKARISSFYQLEEKAGSGKPDERMQITMQMSRMGSKILELENVCKAYGNKVLFNNFSHVFKRGEKAGIVGPNGSGKSTLLNMIMGTVKPDQGRIKAGETMVFGYYSQQGIHLPEDKRVIEVVKDIAEYVDTGKGTYMNAGQFLNHFLFKGSKQQTFVSRLSGGEKRRLYLLTLLIRQPNFLILDEPTNDLDIITLNILEDFLSAYDGCMLLVTHDRYFMDRLVDHVFVLGDNGNIRDIHGNYSDYRDSLKDEIREKRERPSERKEAAPVMPAKTRTGLSYKEKKELEATEKEIGTLEERKKVLEAVMADGSAAHDALLQASGEYGLLLSRLDELTLRWMELSEKAL
jgi:ATP-binding cassette subfamily F protein uup